MIAALERLAPPEGNEGSTPRSRARSVGAAWAGGALAPVVSLAPGGRHAPCPAAGPAEGVAPSAHGHPLPPAPGERQGSPAGPVESRHVAPVDASARTPFRLDGLFPASAAATVRTSSTGPRAPSSATAGLRSFFWNLAGRDLRRQLRQLVCLLAVGAGAVLAPGSAGAGPQPARRIAVVVGANQAPSGRTTLRYAHADARSFASTLVDVAGFGPEDVQVHLDPSPREVLDALDTALAGLADQPEALLVFYFSGHSDARALYPGGRELPLDELRRRLEDSRASVRVGIVDACSGGAWTGAKGIHPAEPFVVQVPFTLGAEGSVLVAASSGAENAHEYERIGGSFFTHHLVAGLRGAAERDGDGVVTLGEAFEYAKAGTLRDSAIYATTPQHPSFVMNLRGRSDLPLARLGGAATRVDVVQRQGPLEVIRLDQALVVLEIPPGERHTTLVLPPGKYVVRRRSHGETFAAEVQVDAGRSAEIREESLVLVGTPSLATKGSDSTPPVLATTLPAGTWEVGMEGGWVPLPYSGEDGADLMVLPRVAVGLGDRWQLSLIMPELAYRFGTAGGTELVASVGVAGFGNRNDGTRQVSPQAAIAVHRVIGNGQAVFGSLASATQLNLGGGSGARFDDVRLGGALGWSMTLGRHLTLSPSVAFVERNEAGAEGGTLFLGAGSSIAGRARPLVRVHLGPSWSVDGNAGFTFSTKSHDWTELYSAGTTWTF